MKKPGHCGVHDHAGGGSKVILRRGLEIPKIEIGEHRRCEKPLGGSGGMPPDNFLFSDVLKRDFLHFQGGFTKKCDHKQ